MCIQCYNLMLLTDYWYWWCNFLKDMRIRPIILSVIENSNLTKVTYNPFVFLVSDTFHIFVSEWRYSPMIHGTVSITMIWSIYSWTWKKNRGVCFCLHDFKLGYKTSQNISKINRAWGKDSTCDWTVRRGFIEFHSGDTSLDDHGVGGRPSAIDTQHQKK